MRILILGAGGMLGHKLYQRFQSTFDTWGTVRSASSLPNTPSLFPPERLIKGIDAFNRDSVIDAFAQVQPDVVINCIGIIKQLPTAKDPIISLTINALFPHQLARLCQASSIRLIHISTDCVFSGQKGMYTEDDLSDAEDLYGRTKYLGEITGKHCLTLRTSIIGRELRTNDSLVDWFLSNEGKQVNGYRKAIYSGVTTIALADIITKIISEYPNLSGIYQVSSEPINKYDLLLMIRDKFNIQIDINPYDSFSIDRSLDSRRFWSAVSFTKPSWPSMIQSMANDATPYHLWKQSTIKKI